MLTKSQFPTFWFYWLCTITVGVILFGISMVLTPNLLLQFFSWLVYSSPSNIQNQFSPEAVRYILLVHAVLGAVMFGWGISLLMLLANIFRKFPKESWNILTTSIFAWYIPDTVFSLWSGFWQNAVFNSIFAILFAIPLISMYRNFKNN